MLSDEPHKLILLQCLAYFTRSPLYPVIQYLTRLSGLQPNDTADERRLRLQSVATGTMREYVLHLMCEPLAAASSPGRTPQAVKSATLDALAEVLRPSQESPPVLLLVEDCHWVDPTTEELLSRIVREATGNPILLLLTCRPDYEGKWITGAHTERWELDRLSNKESELLVDALSTSHQLGTEVREQIVQRADGIPLFLEELTRAATDPDRAIAKHLSASANIPRTLQDLLMSRLDRLKMAKSVAQVGAVIGRDFSHDLISHGCPDIPDAVLQNSLEELIRSALVTHTTDAAGATYSFKHALIRDAAYNSLTRAQRQLRHQHVVASLERTTDVRTAPPELLAFHCQEGGLTERAVQLWLKAAEAAEARSAMVEAVSHYEPYLG